MSYTRYSLISWSTDSHVLSGVVEQAGLVVLRQLEAHGNADASAAAILQTERRPEEVRGQDEDGGRWQAWDDGRRQEEMTTTGMEDVSRRSELSPARLRVGTPPGCCASCRCPPQRQSRHQPTRLCV